MFEIKLFYKRLVVTCKKLNANVMRSEFALLWPSNVVDTNTAMILLGRLRCLKIRGLFLMKPYKVVLKL